MKKQERKITRTDVLAAYQVFGGIIGLVLTAYLLTTVQQFHFILLFILFIAICLYSFSIICGIFIFRNLLTGLRLSRINQLLQVFSFSISGYAFKYVSGIDFSIDLDFKNALNFTFNLATSSWKIMIEGDPSTALISINIVAIVLVIFIEKQITKAREDISKEAIADIGETGMIQK